MAGAFGMLESQPRALAGGGRASRSGHSRSRSRDPGGRRRDQLSAPDPVPRRGRGPAPRRGARASAPTGLRTIPALLPFDGMEAGLEVGVANRGTANGSTIDGTPRGRIDENWVLRTVVTRLGTNPGDSLAAVRSGKVAVAGVRRLGGGARPPTPDPPLPGGWTETTPGDSCGRDSITRGTDSRPTCSGCCWRSRPS